MSRRIAFMDFDGTITVKDSFLEFIKYVRGDFAFYGGFALYSPMLVAFKLKLISNSKAKQIMLRHFFGNMSKKEFDELAEQFSIDIIPSLLRPKAIAEIEKLQSLGFEIVIVSASAENWVQKWAQSIGARWIATKLELMDEKITGRISGENCYGKEKVQRIKSAYDLNEYSDIYCYGDTPGDQYMLQLGTIRFYQPFR